MFVMVNTPWTRGWSRLRDLTLAAKSRKKRAENQSFSVKNKKDLHFFLDIPCSYAKIWGETKFKPWEFPRSGWKAEAVEKEEKKIGENNGQLRFRPTPRVAHASRLVWTKIGYNCISGFSMSIATPKPSQTKSQNPKSQSRLGWLYYHTKLFL